MSWTYLIIYIYLYIKYLFLFIPNYIYLYVLFNIFRNYLIFQMIISHDPTGGLTWEKDHHILLEELFLPVIRQRHGRIPDSV